MHFLHSSVPALSAHYHSYHPCSVAVLGWVVPRGIGPTVSTCSASLWPTKSLPSPVLVPFSPLAVEQTGLQGPITRLLSTKLRLLLTLSCHSSVWTRWQSRMLTDTSSLHAANVSSSSRFSCPGNSGHFLSLHERGAEVLLIQTPNFYQEISQNCVISNPFVALFPKKLFRPMRMSSCLYRVKWKGQTMFSELKSELNLLMKHLCLSFKHQQVSKLGLSDCL